MVAHVAVVTGTSSGIGQAIAARLLAGGWRVFGTARQEEDVVAFERLSKDAVGALIDVRDEAAVSRLVEAVEEDLRAGGGTLKALVNSAGILTGGSVCGAPLSAFNDAIEVNLLGPVRMIRAFSPLLRAAAGSSIVNVSSLAASAIVSPQAPYAAAKAALEAVGEALAQEVARDGIRVTSVVLGVVPTPIHSKPIDGLDLADVDIHVGATRLATYVRSSLKSAREEMGAHEVAATIVQLLDDGNAPVKMVIGDETRSVVDLREHLGADAWRDLWTSEVSPAQWASTLGAALGRTVPEPAL